MALCTWLHSHATQCSRAAVAHTLDDQVDALGRRGIRALAVARTMKGTPDQWQLVGLLTFLDPPRPDSKVGDRCMLCVYV